MNIELEEIIYKGENHKEFVRSCLGKVELRCPTLFEEKKRFMLFYVLGIDHSCRSRVDYLYDWERGALKIKSNANDQWPDGDISMKILRLAFHFFSLRTPTEEADFIQSNEDRLIEIRRYSPLELILSLDDISYRWVMYSLELRKRLYG